MTPPTLVLLLVTGLLSAIAHFVAGSLALNPVGVSPLSAVIGLLFFFGTAIFLLLLVDSIRKAPQFVHTQSGQLDLPALWTSLERPHLESIGLVVIAAYGIASTGNLAEVYRTSVTQWNDPLLWRIEGALIQTLLASPLNAPRFWDAVYQVLWLVLFLGLAALARAGHLWLMAEGLCAVVIAFHLTRYFAISFPTAGPVFYRPELFDLSGTGSGPMTELLRRYMTGEFPQNSFIPGTQAMPSLHVALAWCAMVVMKREWRWTVVLTVPWFSLNWLSTVFLGWHYFIDGLGGIAVMSVSLWMSSILMRTWPRTMGRRETILSKQVRYAPQPSGKRNDEG